MVKDIGERIAQIRKERGLNQDELAELSTLSRITIARYETGKIEPGAKALGRIADALEVSADMLLGREAKPPEIVIQKLGLKTMEGRKVSEGIDRLSKRERQQAVNVLSAMFPESFQTTKRG